MEMTFAPAQVVEIEELRYVVTEKLGCAPNFKYHYNAETDQYIGAPHQYNCTYFSALSGNARLYLLCRVIQFFTPGIPMVRLSAAECDCTDMCIGADIVMYVLTHKIQFVSLHLNLQRKHAQMFQHSRQPTQQLAILYVWSCTYQTTSQKFADAPCSV